MTFKLKKIYDAKIDNLRLYVCIKDQCFRMPADFNNYVLNDKFILQCSYSSFFDDNYALYHLWEVDDINVKLNKIISFFSTYSAESCINNNKIFGVNFNFKPFFIDLNDLNIYYFDGLEMPVDDNDDDYNFFMDVCGFGEKRIIFEYCGYYYIYDLCNTQKPIYQLSSNNSKIYFSSDYLNGYTDYFIYVYKDSNNKDKENIVTCVLHNTQRNLLQQNTKDFFNKYFLPEKTYNLLSGINKNTKYFALNYDNYTSFIYKIDNDSVSFYKDIKIKKQEQTIMLPISFLGSDKIVFVKGTDNSIIPRYVIYNVTDNKFINVNLRVSEDYITSYSYVDDYLLSSTIANDCYTNMLLRQVFEMFCLQQKHYYIHFDKKQNMFCFMTVDNNVLGKFSYLNEIDISRDIFLVTEKEQLKIIKVKKDCIENLYIFDCKKDYIYKIFLDNLSDSNIEDRVVNYVFIVDKVKNCIYVVDSETLNVETIKIDKIDLTRIFAINIINKNVIGILLIGKNKRSDDDIDKILIIYNMKEKTIKDARYVKILQLVKKSDCKHFLYYNHDLYCEDIKILVYDGDGSKICDIIKNDKSALYQKTEMMYRIETKLSVLKHIHSTKNNTKSHNLKTTCERLKI